MNEPLPAKALVKPDLERDGYDAERGRVDKLIGHLIGVRHV